jgi:putative Holliday junction resolvase
VKYLGIDYGEKKIGIALSDARGVMAFPHKVIPNDDHAIAAIVAIVVQEDAGGIVAGDTRTAGGNANAVTEAFHSFAENLQRIAGLQVVLIAEAGTTGAARAGLGEGEVRGQVQSPRKGDNDGLDARAAAVILQRFLEK